MNAIPAILGIVCSVGTLPTTVVSSTRIDCHVYELGTRRTGFGHSLPAAEDKGGGNFGFYECHQSDHDFVLLTEWKSTFVILDEILICSPYMLIAPSTTVGRVKGSHSGDILPA